ncbi:DNA alkylation response protein, partial [Mycobacterium kansasii]
DVLRAMAREPQSVAAFFAELDAAAGADSFYDEAVAKLKGAFGALDLTDQAALQFGARRLVGDMASALQGSLLVRYGHPAVADA